MSLAAVSVGIDRLFTPPFYQWVKRKNIALVTNLASRNQHGGTTFDLIRKNKKAHLRLVFTPEHGLEAKLDRKINHQASHNKIKVISLYGGHRKPTKKQLKNIDVIVFDLQDVGLRYYTFIATLGLVMDAAAHYHIPMIVLDRPDPLGEHVITGDLLEKKWRHHFTSYFTLPMRYGLTMGELAEYNNHYNHVGTELQVVPLKGWSHNMLWPQTGLHWYAPSPALTTFQQVFL